MKSATLVALLPLLAGLAAADPDEVVHAAVIFSRHGDRNWKGQPPTRLTTLGQQQIFQSGGFWRDRYINGTTSSRIHQISTDVYDPNHVTAYSPDQALLATTAQVFMHGLYPPTDFNFENLAAGVVGDKKIVEAPLGGTQFATVHTVPADSPQTMWLKGDDSCPKFDEASKRYLGTDAYKNLQASTKSFYEGFYDRIFAGVMDKNDMGYHNAYQIFDYINVGMIYNDTIRFSITNPELYRLRVLADSHEWELSGAVETRNTDDVLAIAGRTLASNIVTHLRSAISTQAKSDKLTLLVGSYDTFLAFFGLTGLPKVSPNFKGLPDYASAMSFELFSINAAGNTDFPASEDDLKVRFLFKNGSQPIAEYPIFATSRSEAVMDWTSFRTKMMDIGVKSTADWCDMCQSEAAFCKAPEDSSSSGTTPANAGANGGIRFSSAVAGVVGAMAALVTVALAMTLALFMGARMVRKPKAAPAIGKELDAESVTEAV